MLRDILSLLMVTQWTPWNLALPRGIPYFQGVSMHPCRQIFTTKGGGGEAAAPFCCKYLWTGVHWDSLEVWYAPGQHKVSGVRI